MVILLSIKIYIENYHTIFYVHITAFSYPVLSEYIDMNIKIMELLLFNFMITTY